MLMPIQFRLKELLARHQRMTGEKLTYRSLSAKSGVGIKNISLIANQQVKMISLSTIDRLCEVLDCEPGDLLIRVTKKASDDNGA